MGLSWCAVISLVSAFYILSTFLAMTTWMILYDDIPRSYDGIGYVIYILCITSIFSASSGTLVLIMKICGDCDVEYPLYDDAHHIELANSI
jgi:hypothetical protein